MIQHDELEQVLTALKKEHHADVPPPGIEAKLRAATGRAPNRRAVPRWTWACAAAILIGCFVWLVPLSHSDESTVRVESRRPAEELAGFIALPGSQTLPEPSEWVIVRLQMTKQELRTYGLDVTAAMESDLVMAEFVVGEDGLARSVHLVL